MISFNSNLLLADHLVELQMIVDALQNAGFCKAWNKIQELWNTKGTNVQSTMKAHFDATVRKEANDEGGLFYAEESFNLEVCCVPWHPSSSTRFLLLNWSSQKRNFVANVINHRARKSSANLKGYFTSDYQKKAANIARKIDDAAVDLLKKMSEMAIPAGYSDKSTPEEHKYVEALEYAVEVVRYIYYSLIRTS